MSRAVLSRAPVVAALAVASGCTMTFDPPSLLRADEPRVLAVEVTPLEAGPGDRVTLTPRMHRPAGVAATLSWRACPLTLGPQAGYRCVLPACEVEIPAQASGGAELDPTALALACAERAGVTGGGAGAPATVESIEMVFTLTVETGAGATESIVRLPYYPAGAPTPRNRPPRLSGLTVGGVDTSTAPGTTAAPLAREGLLELVVRTDPASLDEYADARGQPATEGPVVSYYSTAGRFTADRAVGVAAASELEGVELTDTTTQAIGYAVVRDGRGGQAVLGPLIIPIR